MVKTNFMVAFLNYHYVIIRPLGENIRYLSINIRSTITNGMNLLM